MNGVLRPPLSEWPLNSEGLGGVLRQTANQDLKKGVKGRAPVSYREVIDQGSGTNPEGFAVVIIGCGLLLCNKKEGATMDWEKFKIMMDWAESMALRERENYWRGYQKGLSRAYYGDKFGTLEEHQKFLDAVNSPDEKQRETGKGYVDALQDCEDPGGGEGKFKSI